MLKYKTYIMTYSEDGELHCRKGNYLSFGTAYEGFSRFLEKKKGVQIQGIFCTGDYKTKGV